MSWIPGPEKKSAAPFRDRNAVIELAEILWDHSSAKVSLKLSYGSAGSQDAGIYPLTDRLVRGVMEAAGVQKWSDLPGRVVRARASATEGVRAVGHAIEDLWVTLGDEPEGDMPY